MSKSYKSAPLPFQGQKRFFLGQFEKALKEINKKEEIRLVVDLFGGSGLLSHTAKRTLPHCKVLYNDFDNYHQRLTNIPQTNILLEDLRILVKDTAQDKKIDDKTKALILDRVKLEEEQSGYVDFVSLSTFVLFSGNRAQSIEELEKQTFYNTVRKSNYHTADGYLDELDIVRQDYRVLFERYKNIKGVLFVVDPPYLSTDVSTYSSDKYWKLADYLEVLKTLKETNFVYFTSNKSGIVELLDWFYINYSIDSPFVGATIEKRQNSVNKTSGYTDMMIYRYR